MAAGDALAAIVIAGGRSSRLGGISKLALTGPDGRTLLRSAVEACAPAHPVVVVGRDAGAARLSPAPSSAAPSGPPPSGLAPSGPAAVIVTCEQPVGSGPARAIGAGLAALSGLGPLPPLVLVLAGDLPAAAPAVSALRAALAAAAEGGRPIDGAVAVAGGQRQWLLGLYRGDALRRAFALPPWQPGQPGESVRGRLSGLDLLDVRVAEPDAADLDTWEDVTQAGFVVPHPDATTRPGDHAVSPARPGGGRPCPGDLSADDSPPGPAWRRAGSRGISRPRAGSPSRVRPRPDEERNDHG